MSFALFWIDCLGGKAIFINANEQYEWVFRPAKAFTTNEIFRHPDHGRTARVYVRGDVRGWLAGGARETCVG